MAKRTTELEQRCPSPPYTRWDQRVKPVLLCHLKRISGKSLCLSLETDDPEIAKRHMRLLVPMLIAKGRLSADAGAAKVYGPKKNGRSRVKKLDTEVRRLKALSKAEYGSAAVATARRWRCPVGIIHYLAGRRPALNARTYATRRMRARERGKQMPMGDTWEHRRQGGRYFYWNGKVLSARLYVDGRQWQWPLKIVDEEKAAALMAPVRVARERLRRAAADELNCELGTDVAVAAAAARAGARAKLARAIIAAGGPRKLAEFVMNGPQEEVGTAVLEPVGIQRPEQKLAEFAMKGPQEEGGTAVPQRAADAAPRATLTATERRLAAEKECEQLLIERYEDYVRNGRKREERPLKDKIRTELTELIPNLSRRSFDKCWKGTAVAQCWDWTLPGQR